MVTSKTAIELTDAATSKLLEVLDEQDAQGQYLRIAVITAAHGGIDYQFGLEETPSEWDRVIEGAVKVLIDDESDTVTVQGVNVRWKHMRRSAANPDGGRVQRITADVRFDTGPEEATAIIAELEECPEIEAISSLRLSRRHGGRRKVRVALTLDAWIVSAETRQRQRGI